MPVAPTSLFWMTCHYFRYLGLLADTIYQNPPASQSFHEPVLPRCCGINIDCWSVVEHA
jgi:hypothetical protein